MFDAVDYRHQRESRIETILDTEVPSIIYFITEADHPVYVTTIVDHFGKTFEERDAYRSVVWELIATNTLLMNNNLSLKVS